MRSERSPRVHKKPITPQRAEINNESIRTNYARTARRGKHAGRAGAYRSRYRSARRSRPAREKIRPTERRGEHKQARIVDREPEGEEDPREDTRAGRGLSAPAEIRRLGRRYQFGHVVPLSGCKNESSRPADERGEKARSCFITKAADIKFHRRTRNSRVRGVSVFQLLFATAGPSRQTAKAERAPPLREYARGKTKLVHGEGRSPSAARAAEERSTRFLRPLRNYIFVRSLQCLASCVLIGCTLFYSSSTEPRSFYPFTAEDFSLLRWKDVASERC